MFRAKAKVDLDDDDPRILGDVAAHFYEETGQQNTGLNT